MAMSFTDVIHKLIDGVSSWTTEEDRQLAHEAVPADLGAPQSTPDRGMGSSAPSTTSTGTTPSTTGSASTT
jgi:hypothetical protein